MLIASMGIELFFEAIIDSMALHIEAQHGVNLDEYWNAWRKNPISFWGCNVTASLAALWYCLFAFTVIPTYVCGPLCGIDFCKTSPELTHICGPRCLSPFFCTTATDVCSCQGGGFELYGEFCGASNDTSLLNATVTKAEAEYTDPGRALGANATLIATTIGVTGASLVLFFLADSSLKLVQVRREKAEAKRVQVSCQVSGVGWRGGGGVGAADCNQQLTIGYSTRPSYLGLQLDA